VTGRDLVTAPLRLIGAVAPGESIPANEATDGLAVINRMISSWSNEGLMIYDTVREEFSPTPGDQQYTMGSGADFNTTRPIEVSIVLLRDESVTPAVEYPVSILNEDQWSDIRIKEIQSTIPLYVFIETSYPNLTINVYPKPSTAHKLVFLSKKPLTAISTLDSTISLPPGYEEAIIYNAATRLAPEYGRQIPDIVMMTAVETKASIKRINNKPQYLKVDDALISYGRFNITTGGFR